MLGNKTIVTNGDQTDTIYEGMDRQLTFEQSLRSREFEPDAPNYTPRISGIMHIENGKYSYAMSILKSNNGNMERFTETLWNSLNEDNKVSLFVRYIDIATGKYETKIVNKNR